MKELKEEFNYCPFCGCELLHKVETDINTQKICKVSYCKRYPIKEPIKQEYTSIADADIKHDNDVCSNFKGRNGFDTTICKHCGYTEKDHIQMLKIKQDKEIEECNTCYGLGYEDGGGDYANETCMVCNGSGFKQDKDCDHEYVLMGMSDSEWIGDFQCVKCSKSKKDKIKQDKGIEECKQTFCKCVYFKLDRDFQTCLNCGQDFQYD